jgi:hypothetical protein
LGRAMRTMIGAALRPLRVLIRKDLVKRALFWMNQKGATAKRVSVLSGNREAIGFYEHVGFRSRVQELMIPIN